MVFFYGISLEAQMIWLVTLMAVWLALVAALFVVSRRRPDRVRPLAWLLSIGVVAALSGNLGWLVNQRHEPSFSSCLSELKMAAVGALLYSDDHDNRMPLAQSWHTDVVPYIKHELHCPTAEGPYGIGLNGQIAGHIATFPDESRQILFTDARDVQARSAVIRSESDAEIRHRRLPIVLTSGGAASPQTTGRDVYLVVGRKFDMNKVPDAHSRIANRFANRFRPILSQTGLWIQAFSAGGLLLVGLGLAFFPKSTEHRRWGRAMLAGFAALAVLFLSFPVYVY